MLNLPFPKQFAAAKRSQPQSSRLHSAILLGAAVAAVGGLVSLGFVQFQKADLRAKATQAEQLLKTDPVDGLVTAIAAMGQNHSRLPWSVQPEVEASLLTAVQTAKERDRLDLQSRVDAVAFSPDAQTIAAAAYDGNVSVWQRQRNSIQTLEGDGQEIGALSFSPDGTALLASGIGSGGSVQFWKIQKGSTYQPPANLSDLTSAAFSSDGQMLVSGSYNGRVQLWSKQGESIAKLYPRLNGTVTAVAFDGPSIASAGAEGRITLWNNKGNRIGYLWAGASVHSLRLSQSGQRIVSQDANRQQAFLWNDQTRNWSQFLLGETKTSRSADLSPDNAIVATGNEQGQIRLTALDPQNRTFSPQTLLGHKAAINTVAFSPDNQTVVSGDDQGSLRLWEVRDGILVSRYHLQEWIKETVRGIALSRDGQYIAINSNNGRVKLGDITQKSIVSLSQTMPSTGLTLLEDGSLVVHTPSGTNNRSTTLSRWGRDGKPRSRAISIQAPEPIRQLAISPDGQLVLSVSATGQLQLWDSRGKALSQPIKAAASAVQFSPDGQQVISSRADGSQTCLWTLHSTTLVQQFCQAVPSSVIAFRADRSWAALGAKDGTVRLWNLQTNQLISVKPGRSSSITAMVWRPDGNILAVGRSNGDIHLLDGQGRAVGRPFIGHQRAIQAIAFREADQSLVSISGDGEVRIWQASWQPWLRTACNRLRHHPILQNPTTDTATEAKAICQRQVWSVTAPTDSTPSLPSTPAATQQVRLVVKLAERRVHLYRGATLQASYPIAVGMAGWETPTGTFKVFQMLQDPAWTHPLTGERVDPGQQNPLGDRWMAFWSDGYNQIGFHGTPDRNSVGQAVSHGCLRMFDEDARALYEQIKLGTVVTVEP